MGTGLGYGSGLVLRQTVRNNESTGGATAALKDNNNDIKKGEVVELAKALGTAGVGDRILLGTRAIVTPAIAALGIAEKDMDKGDADTQGEGQWGHVVSYGLCEVLLGATVAAEDALAVETVTGRLMKATAAQINASEGVGIALTGGADGDLVWAFVNFIHRDTAASSGYGGAETP
jgi:hypothetical protein